ncbi:MAG: FliI/YscN family ATPase [Candidatus Zixiibacteriota bacterium]|nr:MAG: FliI/YscN family ATPase [candidate division Zixibacteria bacterium]
MPGLITNIDKIADNIKNVRLIRQSGLVESVVGLVIEATGPSTQVGEHLLIECPTAHDGTIMAEVVGFKNNKVLIMPLGEMEGISPGAKVWASGYQLSVPVGDELLGRVVNGFVEPIDGNGPVLTQTRKPLNAEPPDPLRRRRITEPLYTGIRAIDCFATCGKGQRMGIFSGSGVGKSTLLGMIAKSSQADINVIGLIGERGREVKDFLEKDLGPEGLERSVVIAVSSDKPPLVRVKAALAATTISEYFRDKGKDVVLMIDSLTRIGMAQREVGLAAGEPPTTKGYTPSVFSFFPKLLERAGYSESGSITGFYTVLVEGDDVNDPIADTTRAILDGHLWLSRSLASKNHFPAIDILESISRLMIDVGSEKLMEVSGKARKLVSDYRDAEDLINIGAYVKGSSPAIDYALEKIDPLNEFLKQGIDESTPFEESLSGLSKIIL